MTRPTCARCKTAGCLPDGSTCDDHATRTTPPCWSVARYIPYISAPRGGSDTANRPERDPKDPR